MYQFLMLMHKLLYIHLHGLMKYALHESSTIALYFCLFLLIKTKKAFLKINLKSYRKSFLLFSFHEKLATFFLML